MKTPKPVGILEKLRMRELRTKGLSGPSIARVVGRHYSVVYRHTEGIIPHREPDPRAVDRAQRIERLFASCNRAIAEARP